MDSLLNPRAAVGAMLLGALALAAVIVVMLARGASGEQAVHVIAVAAAEILFAAFYLTPSMIAVKRRSEKLRTIFILNILVGWTFIGWVVCCYWALNSKPREAVGCGGRAA
jgi:hypothetical protein